MQNENDGNQNNVQNFAALGRWIDHGRHSDVIIRCSDGRRYNAHKIILCLQSGVFDQMLDPESETEESRTGIIELPNEEPTLVAALIEWLYGLGYRNIANYDVNERLAFHVNVYAIAARYGVADLREAARQRLWEDINVDRTLDELHFSWLVERIYETPEHHRTDLRDIAVDVTRRRIEEALDTDGFPDMMQTNAQFSLDLALSFRESLDAFEAVPRFGCRACGSKMYVDLPLEDDDEYYCLNCGHLQSTDDWIRDRLVPARQPLDRYRCRDCGGVVPMELESPSQQLTACFHCGAILPNYEWEEDRIAAGDEDEHE